jgi:hypothetical protein
LENGLSLNHQRKGATIMKRNYLSILTLAIALMVIASGTAFAASSSYSGTITIDEGEALYPEAYVTYNADDYDFGTTYTYNVSTMAWEGTAPASSVISVESESSTVTMTNKSGNPISITLTGTNKNLNVVINGKGSPVKLTLSDLTLNSSIRALQVKKSDCYIFLEGTNSLSADAGSSENNVLKVAGNLIINGTGNLSVTANTKNGIVSDAVICIQSGDIIVTVTNKTTDKGTAIKPMLGFVMLDGSLTIYGNNSTRGLESKGIKVDGYEADSDLEGLSGGMGYVVIDGGTINIQTQGKAISAGWDSDDDDIPASKSDYPSPDVYINGGDISITTYATPRDDTSTVDGVSPEGIEAKNNMYITGGNFTLKTTDDCLNAGNSMSISGGLIYAWSTNNDAIDAGGEENEGYFYISGGALIAMGSSMPETGLDCNSNARFIYTGGIVIAMGGAQNNSPSGTGTSAYTVTTSGASAGKSYALVQNGEVVLAFKVPSGYRYGNSVLLGTEDLELGDATLVSGATVTASETYNDAIHYGTVKVSGGTESSVTVSQSSSNGMGGMGGFGGPSGQQGGFGGGQPSGGPSGAPSGGGRGGWGWF